MASSSTIPPYLIQVNTAYHVTDQRVIFNRDGSTEPHPNWTELRTSMANNEQWDEGFLLGRQCVFFSTTRLYGDLPKRSISVRPGFHWRVQVPLERFNGYRIKDCKTNVRSVNDKQRQFVLFKPEDSTDELNELTDLTGNPDNGCLWRDAVNNWYTNDYRNTKYFVNFAVLENVPLNNDYHWDPVKSNGKIVVVRDLVIVK